MEFENLHLILRNLYQDMMPFCDSMLGVSKGIAGLGALFYISYRVWQSLANAEPIDVFPLLRPFAIGLCIMFFPTIVIGTLNGVLSPIVSGTHKLLESQKADLTDFAKQKAELEIKIMRANPATAYLVDNEVFDRKLESLGWGIEKMGVTMGMYWEREMYKLKKSMQDAFRYVLELVYHAAALTIDVLRTFFLIVLTILGSLSFAISIYDGFNDTLTQWFSRYISIYLWLPIADLFSCILARIQILIIKQDLAMLEADGVVSLQASNAIHIIFMIIGIVGYFAIPTVSTWIIQSGGGGAFTKKAGATAKWFGKRAMGAVGSLVGSVAGGSTGK